MLLSANKLNLTALALVSAQAKAFDFEVQSCMTHVKLEWLTGSNLSVFRVRLLTLVSSAAVLRSAPPSLPLRALSSAHNALLSTYSSFQSTR